MNILLLEDNTTDADLTKRGLKSTISNCTVEVAQNLKQGKELLKNGTPFDIALLDMKLPDGSGMEMLMDIKQMDINIPVIILTGSGNEEVAAAALKAGADDYIVKRQDYISKLPGLIDLAIQNHKQNMHLMYEIIEVLYIEHHSSDIDLTIRHLKQFAPQIHITSLPSADEALKRLPLSESEPGKFQVILLDYRLPGLNAMEFTKIIRQERKLQIPIILVTGQGNENVAILALKLGVNEYLVKRENYLFRLPSLILNAHQHQELIREREILAKSESKYRLLAENSEDVIFTADMELRYTYVSPSVYKLRGYTSEEVMQQTIEDTLTPASYALVMKIFLETKAYIYSSPTGIFEPVTIELEMKRKDGSFISTEVKATILFDENKLPISILGVTRDNTQKKKHEQELILAKEHAEESDRLKSAFLANMSHEIRTPMNGILGFAELLKEANLNIIKQQEYIHIIEKSGARMLNIINDIIDISKIESGQMKVALSETNVNDQMEFIYKFFKNETERKGLDFSFNRCADSALNLILTDREKLYSILTNLIKNAIKYTNSGTIEFGCRSKHRKDQPRAGSPGGSINEPGFTEQNRSAELLQFYVKDTGIGIRKERQEAIFERFIQAEAKDKMARQGAGLGLAISKAYVEMMGGKIWVESEEEKGSTFYFTLPFHAGYKETNGNENGAVSPVEVNKDFKLKILLVEDDESSSQLISISIQKIAAEIIQVQTGTEAVEACLTKPDIDLILMDIQMPQMDGYEATRQIRQFNSDVIIIAQTAYALSGDKEKALEAGCNDYIAKPIRRDALLEMIRKYFKY